MFVVDYIAAPQDIHKEIFALLVVALSIGTGVYLFSFFTSKRYEVIAVYVYIIKVNHYTLLFFGKPVVLLHKRSDKRFSFVFDSF